MYIMMAVPDVLLRLMKLIHVHCNVRTRCIIAFNETYLCTL